MEIGDAPARIDVDLAAANQHLAQLFAPALDPRLHARQRNPRLPRRIGLRQPAKRREIDGCPIGLSEPPDHRGQAWREFGLCRPIGVRGNLASNINLQRIGAPIAALPRAERVTQGIPRNLKQPGLGPIRTAQGPQVADDTQEHLLQQVVGFDTRGYPSREERPQWGAKSAHRAEASFDSGDPTASVTSGGLSAIAPPTTVIPPGYSDTKTPDPGKGRKRAAKACSASGGVV